MSLYVHVFICIDEPCLNTLLREIPQPSRFVLHDRDDRHKLHLQYVNCTRGAADNGAR